jgi:uncharacterized protein (TIGR02145 family)
MEDIAKVLFWIFIWLLVFNFFKWRDILLNKIIWFFMKIKPVWYLASGIILITFGYYIINFSYYTYYLFAFFISAGYFSRKQIDSFIRKKEWLFLKTKPGRFLASISLLFTLFYYIYVFSYHLPYLGNLIYGPRDVQISNQVWMDKNLDVSTFRNGEPMFEAENEEEWRNACDIGQPAWCYFDFKAENGRIYGKLYNQSALYDKRGIAPEGYRIPKTSDIWDLIKNLGGITSADKALKSKDDWIYFSYRGNNSSGFTAIPTSEGYAAWWTLSGYFYLSDKEQTVNFRDYENAGIYEKHSVRCLKGYEKKFKTDLQTIKIGSQIWTSKNLEVSTYLNGEPIRHARTQEEWKDADSKGKGAWCYYNHDPKNGEIYGKLYNWYAVNVKRGLAPEGYHIPSDAEWSILINYLGGDSTGFKMKSTTTWNIKGYNLEKGNNSDSSGFNALAGGLCNSSGDFYKITGYGYWWGSSENYTSLAWNRSLSDNNTRVARGNFSKGDGFSVRCLRD